MVTLGRVVKLIALLLGFYLLCLLLIGLLVAVDVVAFYYLGDHASADRILGVLVFATLGAVFIVIRGVFVSTRVRHKDLPGVLVTPAQQPELWQRVRAMAEAAGTRPPRDIRLVQEVNAAVFEQPHLLGLVPGKRTMLIGVPLMQALTVPQFDSVIGHELGHYSGRDSRLGPLTARVRRGVTAAMDTSRQQRRGEHRIRIPGNALFEVLFTLYARLVLAQTQAMSRRQELAADRLAATIGGRRNAAAALSHLPAVDAAYTFYLNRYVVAGLPVGLVPPAPEVVNGFLGFVNDPDRAEEIVAMAAEPPAEEPHKYDSHPPIADRVAAIMALPDDGRPLDDSPVRAVSLLSDLVNVFAAGGAELLKDHAAGKRVANWDTIAATARTASAKKAMQPLAEIVQRIVGRPARLGDLLDLVDADRLDEVLDQIPASEAALRTKAKGPVLREFKKTTISRMVAAWAVVELAHTGRARIQHTWNDINGELVLADGSRGKLARGVDEVIGIDPHTGVLREIIGSAGVPA